MVKLDKKEKWRVATGMFAGKMIGLLIVLVAIGFLPTLLGTAVHAQVAPQYPGYTPHEQVFINTSNTIWIPSLRHSWCSECNQALFSWKPVFARKRETVNVLMECIFDTVVALAVSSSHAIGYSFMFTHGNGFIGYHWFFLQGAPDTWETSGIPILAHWIFQFAFADTTSTVTSGAMIGRTGFRGDILYSIGVTGFIYPIIGHWAWGPDGWLANMGSAGNFWPTLGTGFRDFAGSTVVHTIGGMVSLAGAIVLGPRLGRVFKRDGGGPPAPHNLTIAAVGGFLLWFGWYGFNPGSTLSAIDYQGIGRVATNTTLAACGGGIGAMYMALWFGDTKGKFDLGYTTNGFLAGLVAITCPCYWVSPLGAILLGLVAGVVVWLGVNLLEYLRIDDPIGAVAVHGFAGMWGTWSLGLFACGLYWSTGPTGADNSAPVAGLFYGGGTSLLKSQIFGSLTIVCATLLVSFVLMWVIMQLPHPWKLRVPAEGETGPGGLDVYEHGVEAYPSQA